MIQHCLQCDRPMHLRGGDMTTTCAECRQREEHVEPLYREQARQLPRTESCSLDLDARALKAKLIDRDRVIAAFRERCQKLEKVADAARKASDGHKAWKSGAPIWPFIHELHDALAALDQEGK